MRARALRLAACLLGGAIGCTRSAPPRADGLAGTSESGSAILAACKREAVDAETVVHDCGDAFVVMEAAIPRPQSLAAVDENLERFVTELVSTGDAGVARVLSRDARDFDGHRAIRVRLELEGKGRFVATMVVVLGERTRVVSCSAKAPAEKRCDAVLHHLVAPAPPATPAP